MAAQNKLFQRLIWLADTIYSAKHITMEEIDSRWSKSPYNDAHESRYGKRNFSRHKDTIAELFGIEIVCDRSTNTYSINDVSRASGSDVRAWIINTFALNNLTNISAGMRDRVIFEEIPEGMRYLSTIINAMKDSRLKQRWYLVGKPEDHPEEKEPRVYALDRVKDLAVTDKAFHLPAAFKAATFFENQFGIDRSKTKAEKIRVKVANWDANFLLSLPLHTSQRVVESNDEYTVFEYKLAPTYDFIMELRKYGSKMEVLAPQSLREEFSKEAEHLAQMYS